MKRIIEDVNWL